MNVIIFSELIVFPYSFRIVCLQNEAVRFHLNLNLFLSPAILFKREQYSFYVNFNMLLKTI